MKYSSKYITIFGKEIAVYGWRRVDVPVFVIDTNIALIQKFFIVRFWIKRRGVKLFEYHGEVRMVNHLDTL